MRLACLPYLSWHWVERNKSTKTSTEPLDNRTVSQLALSQSITVLGGRKSSLIVSWSNVILTERTPNARSVLNIELMTHSVSTTSIRIIIAVECRGCTHPSFGEWCLRCWVPSC